MNLVGPAKSRMLGWHFTYNSITGYIPIPEVALNVLSGVKHHDINRITRKCVLISLVNGIGQCGERVVFGRAPLVAVLILAPVVSGVVLPT